ncbi:molybdopterin synthase [Naviculisporaceae sp. PSN 640]
MASSKAPPGHFTILYFASAGSFTGKQSEHLPAPLPLSKLFATLEEKYDGIKAHVLDHSLVTVNLEYVDMPDPEQDGAMTGGVAKIVEIKEGDEVAIIPPVSSG